MPRYEVRAFIAVTAPDQEAAEGLAEDVADEADGTDAALGCGASVAIDDGPAELVSDTD